MIEAEYARASTSDMAVFYGLEQRHVILSLVRLSQKDPGVSNSLFRHGAAVAWRGGVPDRSRVVTARRPLISGAAVATAPRGVRGWQG